MVKKGVHLTFYAFLHMYRRDRYIMVPGGGGFMKG